MKGGELIESLIKEKTVLKKGDVLKKGLKVMDSTSVSLCMDNKMPMVIFNVRQRGSIKRVLLGEKLGTTVGFSDD